MGYTDSILSTTVLALEGLWLHDPTDPEATTRHFPFGSAGRASAVDTMGAGEWYAGRDSPVVDFGEATGRTYSISLDIPHGPDWFDDLTALEAFGELKKTVVLRDNRGRARYGTISAFKINDQEWGTSASFTFTEVDYALTVVV